MDISTTSDLSDSFATFGDLLKYLRHRAHLTQLEFSIAVGYSEAQISRLEKIQDYLTSLHSRHSFYRHCILTMNSN